MGETLTGSVLVLLTWSLVVVLVSALGLPLAASGAGDRREALRRSLWWGTGILVTAVLLLSLRYPLGSLPVLLIIVGLAVVMGAVGLRRLGHLRPATRHDSMLVWLVTASLGFAITYLALAAMGPVTNYDSGLYHLGAIRYQHEFGLIPGLANLYFPLGYANSLTSLSAFFGASPWELNGFRLVNGALLVLFAIDLISRIRSRLWLPGTMLSVGSLVFVWIPLSALSDYWVTSPSSDSAILILTTVSVAYLADGIARANRTQPWWPDLSVSAGISFVLVSMRPTMVLFAVAILLLGVAAFLWSSRVRSFSPPNKPRGAGTLLWALSTVGLLLAIAQILRDRLLSGWLQYPLSLVSFNVPWRASDPVWFRKATLGAARDPEDLWKAAESWQWISGWAFRALNQWETAMLLLLGAVSLFLVVLVRLRKFELHIRPLLVATIPSAVTVAAWFLASPPAFRFVWGPLFTLAALPGAWAASQLVQGRSLTGHPSVLPSSTLGATCVSLVAVVLFSLIFRWDGAEAAVESSFIVGGVSISYAVSPVTVPEVTESVLESGLVVISPVNTDQCWNQYPMCTPLVEKDVSLSGESLADGFLP